MTTANDATRSTRIAWITGASTGIGAATALRLAKDGWTVAVTARSADKLGDLAIAARRYPGAVMPFPGDVTRAEEMAAVVGSGERTVGPITLAILNAGIGLFDDVTTFTAAKLKRQFDTNVYGIANALESVLKHFNARGSGHVALMASVAGYRGLPNAMSYAATKAAVISLAEGLAIEAEGTGIKIQVINPGFVKTPMTDHNTLKRPMMMDVDAAADRLVRGLASPRFEITFPAAFALGVKTLGWLLPARLYIRLMAAMSRRVRAGNVQKDDDGDGQSDTAQAA